MRTGLNPDRTLAVQARKPFEAEKLRLESGDRLDATLGQVEMVERHCTDHAIGSVHGSTGA
ncbi:MAG: hypothetical protein F4X97_07305 [Boseongicola sp. SB0662_bin_57]|nr:hypothetical protein [Boseongicola sp. SB0662_bin_57]